MSDYIKREDAIFIALQQPLYSVVSQIKQLEGIDIVRCKECKYSSDDGTYGCMSDHFNGLDDVYHRMYADDFCSYGERKESE